MTPQDWAAYEAEILVVRPSWRNPEQKYFTGDGRGYTSAVPDDDRYQSRADLRPEPAARQRAQDAETGDREAEQRCRGDSWFSAKPI